MYNILNKIIQNSKLEISLDSFELGTGIYLHSYIDNIKNDKNSFVLELWSRYNDDNPDIIIPLVYDNSFTMDKLSKDILKNENSIKNNLNELQKESFIDLIEINQNNSENLSDFLSLDKDEQLLEVLETINYYLEPYIGWGIISKNLYTFINDLKFKPSKFTLQDENILTFYNFFQEYANLSFKREHIELNYLTNFYKNNGIYVPEFKGIEELILKRY